MNKKLKEFHLAEQLRYMKETQNTCLGVYDSGVRYYQSRIRVSYDRDKRFFEQMFDALKEYNLIRSEPFEFVKFWDYEYTVIYSITPRGRELMELSRTLENL